MIWRCGVYGSVRAAALASAFLVLGLRFNDWILVRSWAVMSQEENTVSHELFKDVKFYVVGDIDQKVSLWTLASRS